MQKQILQFDNLEDLAKERILVRIIKETEEKVFIRKAKRGDIPGVSIQVLVYVHSS